MTNEFIKSKSGKKKSKRQAKMVTDIRTHFYAFDIVKKKIEKIGRARLNTLSDPFAQLKFNMEN
jgi:hypothetical protein